MMAWMHTVDLTIELLERSAPIGLKNAIYFSNHALESAYISMNMLLLRNWLQRSLVLT
jgi:hypothetical protein